MPRAAPLTVYATSNVKEAALSPLTTQGVAWVAEAPNAPWALIEFEMRPARIGAKLGVMLHTRPPVPAATGLVVMVSLKLTGVPDTQVETPALPATPSAPPLEVVPWGQAVQRLQGSRLHATKPRRTDGDRLSAMVVA